MKRTWQPEGSLLRWSEERVEGGRRRDVLRLVEMVCSMSQLEEM